MIVRIRKMQFFCSLCMLGQIIFSAWLLPFHFFALLLSIIIIGWQRKYCVIKIQYHYYVLWLYIFRLWLLLIGSFYVLHLMYLILCLYVAFMLFICSLRAIL